MTDITHAHAHVSPARAKREEAIEFRLLIAASYPIFLGAAVLRRLLSLGARTPAMGGGLTRRRSVFDEARAAANTYIPFAFMG